MVIQAFLSTDHFKTILQYSTKGSHLPKKDLKALNHLRMGYLLAQINRSPERSELLKAYQQLEDARQRNAQDRFQAIYASINEKLHAYRNDDQARVFQYDPYIPSEQTAFFDRRDTVRQEAFDPSIFSRDPSGITQRLRFRGMLRDLNKNPFYTPSFLHFSPQIHVVHCRKTTMLALHERSMDDYKGQWVSKYA